MKYVCPFCYKTMPEGYEPSGWSCCGEVGHATILPECPKCGAESLELPLAHCAVCGWKSEEYLRRRDCLPPTPRTDALLKTAGGHDLIEFSRQLERELSEYKARAERAEIAQVEASMCESAPSNVETQTDTPQNPEEAKRAAGTTPSGSKPDGRHLAADSRSAVSAPPICPKCGAEDSMEHVKTEYHNIETHYDMCVMCDYKTVVQ